MLNIRENSKLGQIRDTLQQFIALLKAEKQTPWQELKNLYPALNDSELQRLAELKEEIDFIRRFKVGLPCKHQCEQQELINLNSFLLNGGTREQWDGEAKDERCQADFCMKSKFDEQN